MRHDDRELSFWRLLADRLAPNKRLPLLPELADRAVDELIVFKGPEDALVPGAPISVG